MKPRPYPKYKASGVEWLGELPEHWKVNRLKLTTTGTQNGVWGEEPNGVDDVICVRVADFDRDRLIVVDEPPTLRAVDPADRERRRLRKNDLLIEKSGGGEKQLVGCVVHFDRTFEAVCSNFVARMPLSSGHSARFWTYAHASLYAARVNYPAVKQTTGIQNLDTAAYLETRFGFPPLDEQRAIADFLIRETARIDTLVGKKRTLIERLKERRTAVISRTVTRGLPPDAALAAGLDPHPKLKPSGIDWLGDVPEHWQMLRLKHVVRRIEQGWSPDCDNIPADEDSWGVLKAGCCNGATFLSEENKALPLDLSPPPELEIRAGDLLMSRASGSEHLVGSTAIVPEGTRRYLLLSDKTYRVQCDLTRVLPRFLVRVLQSPLGRVQIQGFIHGAPGLAKNIAQSDVMEILVPMPILPEQHAINQFLDRETSRIDQMTEKVETAIERLHEYRSALITAAVTGKIDVRQLAGRGASAIVTEPDKMSG